MATNTLPDTSAGLIVLANLMASGLAGLGESLGITQITPTQFNDTLSAFTTADGAFNAGRAARQVASDNFHAADLALSDWLLKVRSVLAGRLGPRWSNAWAAAGFVNHSTAVPDSIDGRITLASRLAAYFLANPTYQVTSMEVTASKAQSLYNDISTDKIGLDNTAADLRMRKEARDAADEALRTMMRNLIRILSATLSKSDARWEVFGLNIPANNVTPPQPQNLSAMATANHTIVAQCDATPRATRYRWRIKVLGVDAEYRLGKSTVQPLAEITEVLPGQQVDLLVQAVNGSLQGVASEVVRVTVPAQPVAPAADLLPASLPASNGRNGNGAHAPAEAARG